VFSILGTVTFVLILAAILIPHNMVSRVVHDEISAVGSLRAIRDLELRYAAAHPSKGFTCDFALLKAEARFKRRAKSTKELYFLRVQILDY